MLPAHGFVHVWFPANYWGPDVPKIALAHHYCYFLTLLVEQTYHEKLKEELGQPPLSAHLTALSSWVMMRFGPIDSGREAASVPVRVFCYMLRQLSCFHIHTNGVWASSEWSRKDLGFEVESSVKTSTHHMSEPTDLNAMQRGIQKRTEYKTASTSEQNCGVTAVRIWCRSLTPPLKKDDGKQKGRQKRQTKVIRGWSNSPTRKAWKKLY